MRANGRGRSARLGIALLFVAVQLASVAGVPADDDDWTVKWANGFKVESADKKFELKFGGRVHADWSFADPDDEIEGAFGSFPDANEFRRARLFFSGTVYEKVQFKVQYDFAGGDADFKDVWVGLKDTPVGNVRVGHFKEPFSLEELTSSKYLAFLERPMQVEAFAPSRNTGIMFHDQVGNRVTWAVGAFREADGFGETSDGDGKLNLTGRVTGLPVWQDDGKRMVHLGLSLSQKDLGMDDFRFRARPEAHLSPVRLVDTGSFAAEDVNLYNLEVAGVFNRFWFAAEHVQADADASDFGDPSFDGGYVQVGFFLTDDHRRYKASAGAWDRLKPSRNYGEGPGAFEIALRYSTIDLTDGLLFGGEQENFSLGLNWYLNPVTRCMINYIQSDLDGVGDVDFVTARLQFDF